MPRLGGSSDPSTPMPTHSSPSRRPRWWNSLLVRKNSNVYKIIILLSVTFVLRNLFFRDYRSEELYALRQSGMRFEDIEQYVPKTAAERRRYVADKSNDVHRMKQDIAYLLQEVHQLREDLDAQVRSGGTSDVSDRSNGAVGDGRVADDAIDLDQMHLEKRKRREMAREGNR